MYPERKNYPSQKCLADSNKKQKLLHRLVQELNYVRSQYVLVSHLPSLRKPVLFLIRVCAARAGAVRLYLLLHHGANGIPVAAVIITAEDSILYLVMGTCLFKVVEA